MTKLKCVKYTGEHKQSTIRKPGIINEQKHRNQTQHNEYNKINYKNYKQTQ